MSILAGAVPANLGESPVWPGSPLIASWVNLKRFYIRGSAGLFTLNKDYGHISSVALKQPLNPSQVSLALIVPSSLASHTEYTLPATSITQT